MFHRHFPQSLQVSTLNVTHYLHVTIPNHPSISQCYIISLFDIASFNQGSNQWAAVVSVTFTIKGDA